MSCVLTVVVGPVAFLLRCRASRRGSMRVDSPGRRENYLQSWGAKVIMLEALAGKTYSSFERLRVFLLLPPDSCQ